MVNKPPKSYQIALYNIGYWLLNKKVYLHHFPLLFLFIIFPLHHRSRITKFKLLDKYLGYFISLK